MPLLLLLLLLLLLFAANAHTCTAAKASDNLPVTAEQQASLTIFLHPPFSTNKPAAVLAVCLALISLPLQVASSEKWHSKPDCVESYLPT
jgi:hypothetical protein